MLVCVSPPPRFDRQQSADRSRLDQAQEEKAPKERGTVFVREDVQPEMRVNDIVSTRSNRSKIVVLYSQHVKFSQIVSLFLLALVGRI